MGLLQQTSLTVLTRWGGYVLDGAASILVARYVGPSGKGALAVLGVIAGLAMQMGNVGLHAATTYFAARERETLPRIAWVSLVLAPGIGLVLALGLGGLISSFPSLVPNIPALLIAVTLLGIPFGFLLLFFQNILLGQQRIGAYNLLDVGGKVVALPIALIILLTLGGGVPELVAAGLLVSVAMATIAVRLAFRGVSTPFVFDRLLLWRMLTYGLRSYVACLLAFLIIRSDLLLVNYFLGAAEAGIYAVAVNLADLLLVVPTAVGAMLFPRISAQPNDDGTLTAAACRHTAAGMVVLCVGAGILAQPLIPLVYGRAFSGSAAPFLWLLPGVLALSLETIFMNDLAGRGLPPIVMAVPGVGLVLNVALNLVFIPRFGLLAAAVSSSLAYTVMLIIAWGAFARRTATPVSLCGMVTRADLSALRQRLQRRSLGGGLTQDAKR
jgi:O-antigen/teichoic acid export membrane protein